MEYFAVFLAVLFPGAMVALNHELLQTLPRFASLRIYCAGVWHNAAVSFNIHLPPQHSLMLTIQACPNLLLVP